MRLMRLFTLDKDGRRAVLGDNTKLQTDPHFKNLIPFNEYFHGDTGRGCGASHQTGWTGLVAKIIERYSDAQHGKHTTAEELGLHTHTKPQSTSESKK